MRDLHLRHTLTALSRDASEVFTDLVADGQEIPYEIGEAGDGFAFCHYQPLTARFVRDNATELRELESFHEAVETMRRADVAGSYLEEAGIAPPVDAVERASLAVTYFLARLWDGCADFGIDDERFASAVAEIEECAEPEAGEVEAIVPLIGFQMPAARLDLNGAAIVRADAVDVPSEAARSERPGGAAWEPTFLISARVELDEDGGLGGAGDRVARTFERVVTTLRLYKPGGVGLGPHGWVRVAGDRWRRIATGAGKPRPGGYRLTESELEPLTDLSRTVAVHPRRVSRMRRALLRFEAGLDRRGAVDALNDHLLAMRFLLEGEGPAGVGLPMRVAALAEGPDGRGDAKQVVEQAISLERELWSGEPMRSEGAPGPSEIAGQVEELLRTILRRGVTGEIGSDFRAAADEALLADGLAFGEGSPTELGSDTEWDFEAVEVDGAGLGPETAESELDLGFDRDGEEIIASRIQPDPTPGEMPELEYGVVAESASEVETEVPAESEPPVRKQVHLPLIVPGEDEIPEAAIEPEPPTRTVTFLDEEVEADPVREPSRTAAGAGWLDEVDGEATMDFPARPNHLRELSRPPMDREEVRARVEYLFPRTETNWTVGGHGPRRAAG
ncbi:MAG: hypothetical protein R2718_01235 [Solirubrobacterales bacterium]|nr:hypothetical protein [Solirubrobacterales bacterium]